MNQDEKRKVDNKLMSLGFAKLDDKDLIHQLAYVVQNHEMFREIIMAATPEKRNECYESMKPYLRFQAKPLTEYLLAHKGQFEFERMVMRGNGLIQ